MSQTPPSSEAACSSLHHPRFAAFYEWMTGLGPCRRMSDPLREELVSQTSGVVLEIGAGNGVNFPFYAPERCKRVEATEPDPAMQRYAGPRLKQARVPITLTTAPVEALPFADLTFDTVVVTLVFCSVADPRQGFREIRRVLKPDGTLLLLEHVRAKGALTAHLQDALVPLTTRLFGNCHWNRDTARVLDDAGFQIRQQRKFGGWVQPITMVQATIGKQNERE